MTFGIPPKISLRVITKCVRLFIFCELSILGKSLRFSSFIYKMGMKCLLCLHEIIESPRRAMGSIKSDQVERECLIRRLIQENGVKFNKHGNFFMKSING